MAYYSSRPIILFASIILLYRKENAKVLKINKMDWCSFPGPETKMLLTNGFMNLQYTATQKMYPDILRITIVVIQ
ncbi:hypothetical protein DAPPUDRAFT_243920 [Daphnia pulex]|uniref:Uncharacterized protein n=1 Tax=Daphnia pulex TaxID=6669 RepID=E9GJU3_DAPPU|nr:hypothetical protein DAPPUDRAFT_243920 [Daphnia pulex]|eukprot:EFX80258.1 hypothetical protein DAPPUDRAFT_243920 [Daphnia pulex]